MYRCAYVSTHALSCTSWCSYKFAYVCIWLHIVEQENVVCFCFCVSLCPPLDSQLVVWVDSFDFCGIQCRDNSLHKRFRRYLNETRPQTTKWHYVTLSLCAFSIIDGHRLSLSNLFFGWLGLVTIWCIGWLSPQALTLGMPSQNLTEGAGRLNIANNNNFHDSRGKSSFYMGHFP